MTATQKVAHIGTTLMETLPSDLGTRLQRLHALPNLPCRGIDMYPQRKRDMPEKLAVCQACPIAVREECLDIALAMGSREQWGVWGGMPERRRRQIARRYEQAERAAKRPQGATA